LKEEEKQESLFQKLDFMAIKPSENFFRSTNFTKIGKKSKKRRFKKRKKINKKPVCLCSIHKNRHSQANKHLKKAKITKKPKKFSFNRREFIKRKTTKTESIGSEN